MSEPEFRGRVVVVTGGANGIGESIVRAFHAAGAQVCFCDLDQKKGAILANELGERVDFRAVDLAREEEIMRWIQGIGESRGRVGVLVNNAGRDPRIPLEQTTAADWDALFATNLRSCFLACRESVRWMPSGASIVNLASITFHQGPPAMSAYVATKGGIIAFTRSLARELGPKGIRVNTVSPGWVMTERQLRQFITPEVTEMIKRSQCIPELVQPDEIADAVLFLAGRASRAITGQELLVDRGWHHS
jgi:NAD(P)-dependent dehydrogenase (short-subunit alcohol dehydrogenase family)